MGYGEKARSPGAIDETARRSVVKNIGSLSSTTDLVFFLEVEKKNGECKVSVSMSSLRGLFWQSLSIGCNF